MDMSPSRKKSKVTKPRFLPFNSVSAYYANLFTVLKSMIQTASLMIPSPKTMLKSLGCVFGFSIETAAMTSVAHKSEHMSKISMLVKVSVEVSLHKNKRMKSELKNLPFIGVRKVFHLCHWDILNDKDRGTCEESKDHKSSENAE